MSDPSLQALILKQFVPGCGAYQRSIVDGLWPIPASQVRREMRQMRRDGILYYAAGHGYWTLLDEARRAREGQDNV